MLAPAGALRRRWMYVEERPTAEKAGQWRRKRPVGRCYSDDTGLLLHLQWAGGRTRHSWLPHSAPGRSNAAAAPSWPHDSEPVRAEGVQASHGTARGTAGPSPRQFLRPRRAGSFVVLLARLRQEPVKLHNNGALHGAARRRGAANEAKRLLTACEWSPLSSSAAARASLVDPT